MSVKNKFKYVLIFGLFNFITYFSIQALVTTNRFDFMTSLDTIIPLVPNFIWVYHTLLPVVMITMIALMKKRDVFFLAFFSFMLTSFILSIFYVLFPSFYPRGGIDVACASTWLMELTRGIDSAHNTFPSGHVAFSWLLVLAVSNATYIQQRTWLKISYVIWALLISISTLVLKQHYIVDVASGIVLACLCYFFSKKIMHYVLKAPNERLEILPSNTVAADMHINKNTFV